jgi:hypothetical protein
MASFKVAAAVQGGHRVVRVRLWLTWMTALAVRNSPLMDHAWLMVERKRWQRCKGHSGAAAVGSAASASGLAIPGWDLRLL